MSEHMRKRRAASESSNENAKEPIASADAVLRFGCFKTLAITPGSHHGDSGDQPYRICADYWDVPQFAITMR